MQANNTAAAHHHISTAPSGCTCTGQETKRQPGLQATCTSDPSTHAVSRSHCGLVTSTRTYAPGPISYDHSSRSLSPSYWLAQLRPFARRCDSDAESQTLARELKATGAGSKRSLLPRQCASLTRTSSPRGQCQCIHGLRLNLQASSVLSGHDLEVKRASCPPRVLWANQTCWPGYRLTATIEAKLCHRCISPLC